MTLQDLAQPFDHIAVFFEATCDMSDDHMRIFLGKDDLGGLQVEGSRHKSVSRSPYDFSLARPAKRVPDLSLQSPE
jgi:hypothetical protein